MNEDFILTTLHKQAEDYTPQDIDNIIVFLRKHRQDYQSGVKPKKVDDVDISKVLSNIKPKITPGRRF